MKSITFKDIEKVINEIDTITYVAPQNKILILFKDDRMWHINSNKSVFHKLRDKFSENKSSELKVVKRVVAHRKTWTKEEVDYLSTTSDYIHMMCMKLNRNYDSVRNKLRKISNDLVRGL